MTRPSLVVANFRIGPVAVFEQEDQAAEQAGDDAEKQNDDDYFQQETGQLENPQKMKQTRRAIARIKTILKEDKINEKNKKE